MSHVTTGSVCITDLNDLDAAVKCLGGELVRGQKTHKWFGRFMDDWHNSDGRAATERGFSPDTFGHCEHAVRIPDHIANVDYEVGVVKRSDGKGWDLVWDTWGIRGKRIAAAFGKDLATLKTEHGIAALRRAYRGKRIVVTRDGGKAKVRIHA